MPDSLLNNCRDSMSEEIFYNLQRFQYDCKTEFGGPCDWISDFYQECIDPLDLDTLSDHEACMFEGVSDSCEVEVTNIK